MDTMTAEQARKLLKASGYKLKDLAIDAGVKPNSLSDRWRKAGGLDAQQQMIVNGYIAMHDSMYIAMNKHRDNEALQALLSELDK